MFDLATNQLIYVRAGHVPPFLRRADGSIERLAHGGGLPLGLMEDARYTSATVSVNTGDAVLVLTDGFTEAADADEQLFGESRIERYLSSADPARTGVLQALVQDVRSFEAGRPASDDMAAIMVSFTRAVAP
jgi:sigma-B regulation protein RsbU (phosphoserine phosphatase)